MLHTLYITSSGMFGKLQNYCTPAEELLYAGFCHVVVQLQDCLITYQSGVYRVGGMLWCNTTVQPLGNHLSVLPVKFEGSGSGGSFLQ